MSPNAGRPGQGGIRPGRRGERRRGSLLDREQYSAPERASRPGRAAYERYIASDGWRTRRTVKLRQTPACEACGVREHLHVHHRTYERFGAERMGDLRTLCEICHAWVHHIERSMGKPLAEATDIVIETRRAPQPEREPLPVGRGKSSYERYAESVRERQRRESPPLVHTKKAHRQDRKRRRARTALEGYTLNAE